MAKKRRHVPYENNGVKLGKRGTAFVIDIPAKDGRARQRVKLEAKTEDAAKAELDAFVERQKIIQRQQASYTVGQLWDWWLKEREQDGLSNEIYSAQWRALGSHFAPRCAEALDAQTFRDYARARFEQGRAPWTVHTEISRLVTCLKRASKARKIAFMPETWNCSQGQHRERVLSLDEATRLVEAARQGDPHISLFVVVAFATGARHKAILDLVWDRVDWVHGTLQFDDEPKRDPMSKSWRKGRALVPMNRAVRTALEQAYEGRQSNYVIEHGGRRLKSVKSGFANAVRRAGLSDDITPHTIRHTCATWLESRVDDSRRAQLLGHSGTRTLPVYTHSGAAMLTEAVGYLDFAPLPRIEDVDAAHSGNGTAIATR